MGNSLEVCKGCGAVEGYQHTSGCRYSLLYERPVDAPSRVFDDREPLCTIDPASVPSLEDWDGITPGASVAAQEKYFKAQINAKVLKTPRYEVLRAILNDAFLYASVGKGEERHGKGSLAWEHQRHAEISKEIGTGFPIGQAVKKAYESQGLDDAAAERELLGAITYMASAIYAIRKGWRK